MAVLTRNDVVVSWDDPPTDCILNQLESIYSPTEGNIASQRNEMLALSVQPLHDPNKRLQTPQPTVWSYSDSQGKHWWLTPIRSPVVPSQVQMIRKRISLWEELHVLQSAPNYAWLACRLEKCVPLRELEQQWGSAPSELMTDWKSQWDYWQKQIGDQCPSFDRNCAWIAVQQDGWLVPFGLLGLNFENQQPLANSKTMSISDQKRSTKPARNKKQSQQPRKSPSVSRSVTSRRQFRSRSFYSIALLLGFTLFVWISWTALYSRPRDLQVPIARPLSSSIPTEETSDTSTSKNPGASDGNDDVEDLDLSQLFVSSGEAMSEQSRKAIDEIQARLSDLRNEQNPMSLSTFKPVDSDIPQRQLTATDTSVTSLDSNARDKFGRSSDESEPMTEDVGKEGVVHRIEKMQLNQAQWKKRVLYKSAFAERKAKCNIEVRLPESWKVPAKSIELTGRDDIALALDYPTSQCKGHIKLWCESRPGRAWELIIQTGWASDNDATPFLIDANQATHFRQQLSAYIAFINKSLVDLEAIREMSSESATRQLQWEAIKKLEREQKRVETLLERWLDAERELTEFFADHSISLTLSPQ